ncbi:hypothetical protein [Nostoc sp.]
MPKAGYTYASDRPVKLASYLATFLGFSIRRDHVKLTRGKES